MEGGAIDKELQLCPFKEQLASWAEIFQQHDCTIWLYPKLDIDESKWTKNCSMNGGNEGHVRHERTFLEKKTNCLPYTS